MADELKELPGCKVELVEGSGGIFEVDVNGQNLFSKRKTGRFPEPGEVAALIQKRAARA